MGLYAQAYKLVLLPIQQINTPVTSVALPTLSSLQSEPQQYYKYYYKAMLSISALGMPMIGFLFAFADKVILVVLGEQWLETVPIFQLLMPAALNAIVGVGLGWAYQSLGNVRRQLHWGIASSIANAILFVIGVRWGAIGVAAIFGLSRPLFLIVGFVYCYYQTPPKLTKLISTLYPPAFASIGAVVILTSTNLFSYFPNNPYLSLLIDLGLYILLYFLIWILLPNGRKDLWAMLQLTKVLRKK